MKLKATPSRNTLPILNHDVVKTCSREDTVTLSGIASADSHKLPADNTASGLPGVISIVNRAIIETPVQYTRFVTMAIPGDNTPPPNR